MRLSVKAAVMFLLCMASVYFVLPNFTSSGFVISKRKVSLGLDLRGGVHLLFKVGFEEHLKEKLYSLSDDLRSFMSQHGIEYDRLYVKKHALVLSLKERKRCDSMKAFSSDAAVTYNGPDCLISFHSGYTDRLLQSVVSDSIKNIQSRLDRSGTKEITIKSQGKDKISLQIPGVYSVDSVKSLVGRTAKLTFHLLEDVKNFTDIDPGHTVLMRDSMGVTYPVLRKVEISGEALVGASAGVNSMGKAVVNFKFNGQATKKFAEVTRKNVGKPFAAVLDGVVLTAPIIHGPILGGTGEISGRFDLKAAKELAVLLNSGALPAPLSIVEEKTVGPSLGARAISQGKIAVVMSILMVMVLIVSCYGVLGVFAIVGLVFNIVFVLLAMTLMNATLTLSGIAGITLTVGMSIDANVLIFERIREEVKASKRLKSAINRGFRNAMSTIFDSNITTLIVAAVMFMMGSASVSGFAVTLAVGIVCSMLSAVTLTKILIDLWVEVGNVKTINI